MTNLDTLIRLSRRYGADADYVLAGGGNTSMKDNGSLYVKASGFSLADITKDGFVRMKISALEDIWQKEYPKESEQREVEVLADMKDACFPGKESGSSEKSLRPSVEALLHSLIEGKFVIHTHPALVNGLTCGADGEEMTNRIFGKKAVWVPSVNPGYILAREARSVIRRHLDSGNSYPEIILLQNHGVFIPAETEDQAEVRHTAMMEKLSGMLKRIPSKDLSGLSEGVLKDFADSVSGLFGADIEVRGAVSADILAFSSSDKAFEAVELPFNPDQIVYSGPGPVCIDNISGLTEAVSGYRETWGRDPIGILVKDSGLFAFSDSGKKADTALALILDTLKIAVYAESFGGPNSMTIEQINFILNWEVERYRAAVH